MLMEAGVTLIVVRTGAGANVTVIVSADVFPAWSRAVTVITFDPVESVMPADQEFVPVQVPLPPRLFDQETCVTP